MILGNGFSAYNWIGPLRNDMDIFQTAEGDGTVLHQQQAKYLLKQFKKSISSFSGIPTFSRILTKRIYVVFWTSDVVYIIGNESSDL
jgi:hypothetical protein